MTTFKFSPGESTAFQFKPVLDGVTYIATVTWNIAGERWYLTLKDQSGNRILTTPVVGSPNGETISMTEGYFDSTLTFNTMLQTFTVLP